MYSILLRFCGVLVLAFFMNFSGNAQEPDSLKPTSVDPNLLEWQQASRPKEYTISAIKTTGVYFLDSSIVISISGLQVGDKILHPGGDEFSSAIQKLWKQRLFSDIQIFVTKIQEANLEIEIHVMELPRLGSFHFKGIRKTEQEELLGKLTLAKQTIVTENTRRNSVEVITKYYSEKGFGNVVVKIDEAPDTAFSNSVAITFIIDKGEKVKINNINFFGNETISDLKLKKQLKGTKELSRFTLYPQKDSTIFGTNPSISFKEYVKDRGYFSFTKTKNFLDPWFRFNLFSSAKFDEKKFEEDKEKLLEYFNKTGYRDASIEDVRPYALPNGNINIDFKINEGQKYFFGNTIWKGNSKYPDSLLSSILGIRKGDVYNIEILNQRLGKQLLPEGGDISGLYMDDGYLFFRADPVEMRVYSDTIDHEIRIVEGPQARIKNVKIFGNDKTKEYVVRRELRTVPGELFSRADLIRSQRELGQLNFFNQETIGINPIPNPEDGTVDIHYKLEEKSSDQVELSAGWGGGIGGLTGTLGFTFNNFSLNNIFNKKYWDPLPTGDGQKLSLRIQTNGKIYSSYNFSFTEPWLGGKKRNSFTTSFYSSKFTNGFDYMTQRFVREKADSSYLKTRGASISLGKQLKWPDDYFSLVYSLNFTQYKLRDYPIFAGLDSGNSTNFSFKVALNRNSAGPNPIFPTTGSNFMASLQLTLPYSLLNSTLASDNSFKHPEYHKWRFNAEWYVPLGRPMGAEKNRQFIIKLAAKYGFMGRYNTKLDHSPFERFQLGDAGMSNNYNMMGYDIVAHRGYSIYETSNPSVNAGDDVSQARNFFTMFNKYQLELRYPFTTSPSSTIFGLVFFEAANGWYNFREYNPFQLRRSVGAGMRFFLPMFGLLGFDYGIGIDRLKPGAGLKSAAKFTFMMGYEPE